MFSFFKKRTRFNTGAVSVMASVFLVTIGAQVFVMNKRDSRTPVRLKTEQTEYRLRVYLAATPEEQVRGLMWVKKIPRNGGMLFVYESPQDMAFWMKNMRTGIDILFIGSDRKIKSIAHETYPCMEGLVCPRYVSSEPVQYVLELSSGYAKEHRIGVGDELIL